MSNDYFNNILTKRASLVLNANGENLNKSTPETGEKVSRRACLLIIASVYRRDKVPSVEFLKNLSNFVNRNEVELGFCTNDAFNAYEKLLELGVLVEFKEDKIEYVKLDPEAAIKEVVTQESLERLEQ